MSTEISLNAKQNGSLSVYDNLPAFEVAQRISKALAASTMVPELYRNNTSNCMIALEMAYKMNESVLTIMQNSSIIHGKLGMDAKFITARINQSGLFTRLKFKYEGEGETRSCIAYAKDADGDVLESVKITWKMAVLEGWTTKKGSKWLTMPDLMLSYRASTFFGRVHCPELLMGMQSQDELIDIGYEPVTKTNVIKDLNSKIEPQDQDLEEDFTNFEEVPVEEIEVVDEEVISTDQPPIIEDDDF